MKKLCLLILLVGCRHAHLGPDVGVAYHIALDAQENAPRTRTPGFTATDAQAAMAARRGKSPAAAGAAAPAAIIEPMPAAGDSSGGGTASWPGASGNISLEAK